MALNAATTDILSAPTSSFSAYQSYVAGRPNVASQTTAAVYNGTPTIAPPTSIWNTISQNIAGAANTIASAASAVSAVKSAFVAPKAQTITTTTPASAGAVPVSSTTPQAAPTTNISVTPTAAQGSQAASGDNTLLWIGGGAVLLILVIFLMRK